MAHQSQDRSSSEPARGSGKADIALERALEMLPLHAEEGRWREVIAEAELVIALVKKDVPEETARALVWTLRRQFEAMALLDPVDLSEGNWAFISFPASLLGRSWLTILSTPTKAILPAGYWGQDAADGDKEEQRALLQRIETGRVRLNPQAPPIRVVHVAWAWIRIGDQFLMYRREDKTRPGQKSFGLPGGRFSLFDLPANIYSKTDTLREIFQPDSEIVAKYIQATLEREIKEETDLTPDKHYTYEAFGKPLPPYLEVNGAGNRHAYTSYQFYLYHVKLTHLGETHLLDQISRNADVLKWFTPAEIAAPQRTDGDSAYVDALHNAWGEGLSKYLSKVPDSCANPRIFAGESMMLDLPSASKAVFKLGKSGKEKTKRLTRDLEEAEWQLLMLLGWHARGFGIRMAPNAAVRLLGNGWIEATNAIQFARSLHEKIQSVMPDLVEIREDRYVTLRILPEILFFPVDLFRYKIIGNSTEGGIFQLERREITTTWGNLDGYLYEKHLNGKTVAALRGLEKGDDPPGDWARTLREQLGNEVKKIGLRRLWIEHKNLSCLVEGLQRISDAPPDA